MRREISPTGSAICPGRCRHSSADPGWPICSRPHSDTDASDPLGDYRAGLRLLAAVPGVRWLVPGHGHVGDAAEFRRRLDVDARYLDLLAAGEPFDDPRCTQPWLRDSHRRQLRSVAGVTEHKQG